jgi:RNA ligase
VLKNLIGVSPNWEHIAEMVSKGYVSIRCHPEDETLKVYNYTARTQYERVWNASTLMTRGLITRDNEVIARPFQKFFNYDEIPKSSNNVLKGPWEVLEKLDGSLGILYKFRENDYRIATRGSFDSPQAIWATKFFKEHFLEWKPIDNLTYLFEIIYPENKIVVDYENREELLLLDVLETKTNERVDVYSPFERCPTYGFSTEIPMAERNNKEGYVLVNSKGFRVKVKHEQYKRLHKLITECSNITVWEYLSQNLAINELIDNLPDEHYPWLKNQIDSLKASYEFEEFVAKEYYDNRPATDDRKELAAYFTQYKFPWMMFCLLDDKDYSENLWKVIKPERKYLTLSH